MRELENEYQALNELQIMSKADNYNNWIWDTIKQYIGTNVLEVGAGIGTFTEYLLNKDKVYATDIAQNCLKALSNRFRENLNIDVLYLDITSKPDTRYWEDKSIDSIICLNVIEHIENDLDALKNMASILKPGAQIILMVPAFQFIYGTIDQLDGHYRRYTLSQVKKVLSLAGFKIPIVHYFNSVGLLAWLYTNKIVKNRSTSLGKVVLYDKYVVPWLKHTEHVIKPPFGQSVVAVGKL